MSLNEADTRAKLIDSALYKRGWTEDQIKREETAGAIDVIGGKPRHRARGRIDYLLRVKINIDTQPVAMALIKAKGEGLPSTHGLEQAKAYAESKRLNVAFVFSTNGHQFVEFDRLTKVTSAPRPIAEFPTPDELRTRYENHMGFSLAHPAAKPLLTRYQGGEATRRYYQDAAIRAVFEKIARCQVQGEPPRSLLSLATGAGKTFIVVNLLRRIADSGQPIKALFICDRDELRQQASGAFQNVFGADAAVASAWNPQKNARILIATYQTLDVDNEEATANFLTTHYPEHYFTHIIIDECHRSAWGKWSEVLLYTAWCQEQGKEPVEHYAFKCTAAGGSDYLADLRGSSRDYIVATTVDLLTTGVDVPCPCWSRCTSNYWPKSCWPKRRRWRHSASSGSMPWHAIACCQRCPMAGALRWSFVCWNRWKTATSTTCWPSLATAPRRAPAPSAPRRLGTRMRTGWPRCRRRPQGR